ncbi:hypothetical protein SG34_007930 [Thalassomonas viridans]|uniref:Uncharacterized protein n=1 Tax=Thalassomonas viridans TaxID=137584 RepID=A0AAE9Z5U8_9GAMM|nr:hypothetical protein [Thalassomonas viridans]WDE06817.1 hypothetical protein SG34_007930 [Thalassomonas viridans]
MSEYTPDPDSEVDPEADNEPRPISRELTKLTNDFAAFSADCAFLCDAFAAIITDQEDVDEVTAYGFSRHTDWLKNQIAAFDHRIETLQRRMREQV